MISASYCGSEMGDLDIYSPYSYYGSEAGGDVTGDINDSVWGMPSVGWVEGKEKKVYWSSRTQTFFTTNFLKFFAQTTLSILSKSY